MRPWKRERWRVLGKRSGCWWKDSPEEVEVVADVEQEQLSSQEPEEKPEEQSQERARPGTPSDLPDHTGGAGVTGGPSGSEFNSGNVKDHRAYIWIR